MASSNFSRRKQCVYSKNITPLTMKNEGSEHWLGENGIMFAIVTCIFGIYFWIKAIKKKM